jgi:gamma-glutamylcyclotransferase (GGCT)/AIG2-like uncharacterized protein YtfP
LLFDCAMNEPRPNHPLFVYGTLLPGERNYPRFLAGRTEHEFPARTEGELWLVETEDYPYLVPGCGEVHGCLISISAGVFNRTLQAIDRLEDYHPRQPRRSLYLRQLIPVATPAGPTLAWSYIWNCRERTGLRLASGDFSKRRIISER